MPEAAKAIKNLYVHNIAIGSSSRAHLFLYTESRLAYIQSIMISRRVILKYNID